MADQLRNEEIAEATNYASRPRPSESEDHLDDENSANKGEFVGATLALDGQRGGDQAEVEFAGPGQASRRSGSLPAAVDAEVDLGISRARPGSVIGRKSAVSTGSRTTMSSRVLQSDISKEMFFCNKNGEFENAVEKCRAEILNADMDGDIRGAWLLTEIDHWDNERERIVLLCDKSFFVVRYDFITNKVKEGKRILLQIINTIRIGDFVYPPKSLMPPRDHGGIRIYWGSETSLSFGQKWNPFCTDIPYLTFAHHKLIYNEKEKETVTYNVDDFYESLVQGINIFNRTKANGKTVHTEEGEICIESYASLASMVFNQSHIGYNRDRNGVSF